ncbi:MAG: M3 family metallopeptidase [Ahrensia sp.]|nr:M3 family metallopeptidase [Ahrensia sp.]
MTINTAIYDWTGPHGLPRFETIDSADYAAAFEIALKDDRAQLDAIAEQDEATTFDNTITRLELSGEMLSRTASLFFNLIGANSDDTLRGLERDIAPKLSQHMSQTAANAALFARIDTLWQQRDTLELTVEQKRVLERHWKGFVRGGAALAEAEQSRLADINARLAELGASFSQNILADEADWSLIIDDEAELAGLPESLRQSMSKAASELGEHGKHAVTLSRSIIEPFLTYSDRRELREQAFAAWQARGENDGPTDNRDNVREIVALRQEKAQLLGYASFADFKLEDQMAKTPAAVNELLETVWSRAVATAAREQSELEALAAETGHNHAIEPWDWRYFAEKLRAKKYDLDAAQLKPYFALDAVINAAFDVANRLFNISFDERADISTYHQDVRVFEVRNADGSHRALFLADYFARASKRSGAWMSALQGQHALGEGRSPIIFNIMNFAKPPEGEAALLSSDDARTLFHEFGHALHGIMSDVTYPSVAGTAVARDFVELPSQLYEHWLTTPEVLAKHARHVETEEAIPQDLLDKLIAAQKFNAGFATVEFTASALVDMAFHAAHAEPVQDVVAFERETLDRIGMPSAIAMRHRTPHFAHVFSGDGYSAGYYSYMWSEVLDADAFAAFEEAGDVFDPDTSQKLRDHIYTVGGSVDAEDAYLAFRGKMPSAHAMMDRRGLDAA